MKNILNEISSGGMGFEDPGDEPKKPNKYANRMGLGKKTSSRGPLGGVEGITPDYAGPSATDMDPTDFRDDTSVSAAPSVSNVKPVGQTPYGGRGTNPDNAALNLSPMMSEQDIDALRQEIEREESKPPHQRNEAKIASLKDQVMRMWSQSESMWVQQAANRVLPKLQEDTGAKVYCPDCDASAVNGSPCHEEGCPSKGQRWVKKSKGLEHPVILPADADVPDWARSEQS